MKRSPELKPNFWDGIVALAVIALAAAAALTVWQSRPENGALTAVVSANGQEIDRFVPADLENEPRTYAHNGYTLTVTAEGRWIAGSGSRLSHSGLRSHGDHHPQRPEHRLPPGPDCDPAHRRPAGRGRRGHCNRIGAHV